MRDFFFLTAAGVAGAGLDGILLEIQKRRGRLAGHGLLRLHHDDHIEGKKLVL